MGSRSAPAPAPAPAAPAPVVTEAGPDRSKEPANRAVAQRALNNENTAGLLQGDLGSADVDPLSQRKQLGAGGGANLIE